jgi:hypothetical protein
VSGYGKPNGKIGTTPAAGLHTRRRELYAVKLRVRPNVLVALCRISGYECTKSGHGAGGPCLICQRGRGGQRGHRIPGAVHIGAGRRSRRRGAANPKNALTGYGKAQPPTCHRMSTGGRPTPCDGNDRDCGSLWGRRPRLRGTSTSRRMPRLEIRRSPGGRPHREPVHLYPGMTFKRAIRHLRQSPPYLAPHRRRRKHHAITIGCSPGLRHGRGELRGAPAGFRHVPGKEYPVKEPSADSRQP